MSLSPLCTLPKLEKEECEQLGQDPITKKKGTSQGEDPRNLNRRKKGSDPR